MVNETQTGRAIGYEITRVWCRACAPEAVSDSHEPIREGQDYGVAYHCDDCGTELRPCEHKWSEWHNWFAGGEFRICELDGCGETEHR